MPIAATRIFHFNVNCSDLRRSLAFYQDLVGLVPATHTVPDPQPGEAFALPTAQWDAWILTGARGYEGVVLDLLEWKTPPPTGRPYSSAAHLGFARLGIEVRDLDGLAARLGAAGVDCLGPPHPVELGGQVVGRAFVAADPDGTLVEFTAGDEDRVAFLVVNCSDLERSVRFYTEIVGLSARARIGPVRTPARRCASTAPSSGRARCSTTASPAASTSWPSRRSATACQGRRTRRRTISASSGWP